MTEEELAEFFDKIDEKLESYLGKNLLITYSAYPEDENGKYIDNLESIAAEGLCIFTAERDEFFGGRNSRSYKSRIYHNPTWVDVCEAANESIKRRKDTHHMFLEDISFLKEDKYGVKEYTFFLGS